MIGAKADVKLDGQSIEIICQELREGIKRAKDSGDLFRADFLQMIIDELQQSKQRFHAAWLEKLLKNREKRTKMGS